MRSRKRSKNAIAQFKDLKRLQVKNITNQTMKFNTIIYERSIKRYNEDTKTARVELTVEPGDEPHVVMELAAAFVDTELGVKAEELEKFVDGLERRKQTLEHELKQLNRKLDIAKANWEKASAFLNKHGVSLGDDIPF
jgi:chaperonin cofactor prefoldin